MDSIAARSRVPLILRRARIVDVAGVRLTLADTIDSRVFDEVFVDETYRCDYRHRHVIDIGAHKGYFGAYALARGARSVVSYEPAAANFACLAKAAQSATKAWWPHRAAVGGVAGTRTLVLSDESWAHALGEGPGETVDVVAIGDLLDAAPAARLILKIDAEGAEWEIANGALPGQWRKAERVFIEWHRWAPCSFAELRASYRHAGFAADRDTSGGVLRLSRR